MVVSLGVPIFRVFTVSSDNPISLVLNHVIVLLSLSNFFLISIHYSPSVLALNGLILHENRYNLHRLFQWYSLTDFSF